MDMQKRTGRGGSTYSAPSRRYENRAALSTATWLQYLSPLGWEHINLTGDYVWNRAASDQRSAAAPWRNKRNSRCCASIRAMLACNCLTVALSASTIASSSAFSLINLLFL